MAAAKPSWPRRLWRNYLEQVPDILANLTVAAILFAAAVLFQPWLQRLFSPPSTDYPISCSADLVSVDMDTGRTRSAFFIVNHTNTPFDDNNQLAERLSAATGNQGAAPDTSIVLRYGGYNGRFVAALPDRQFNGDKGELEIATTPTSIRIHVTRIAAAAVLKVDIDALQSPAPEQPTRNTKAALPFVNQDYEHRCYRG